MVLDVERRPVLGIQIESFIGNRSIKLKVGFGKSKIGGLERIRVGRFCVVRLGFGRIRAGRIVLLGSGCGGSVMKRL